MNRLFTFCFILFSSVVAHAESGSTLQVTDEYLNAWQNSNTDKLRTLLADDAIFVDVLGKNVEGLQSPTILTSKETILSEIKKSSLQQLANTQESFELDYKFSDSDTAVYVGTMHYRTIEKDFRIDAKCKIIISVSLKDGLVAEHRVYADYEGLDKSMNLTELKPH